MKKFIVVVAGPTGIGKTNLSVFLAKKFNSEIISFDSRQFYKEISIGTNVPSNYFRKEVKHHFIQNISISNSYSIGKYEKDALKIIEKIHKRNNVIIMVGGSGLYLDAIIHGLDSFPKIKKKNKNELYEHYRTNGIEYLKKKLKELDENYYNKVDINNPQRLIRAIEVCMASDKTYSSYLTLSKKKRKFDVIKIILEEERNILYERINDRVDKMVKKGLIQEVSKNIKYKKYNSLNTIGYKEIFEYLDGKQSLFNAIEKIKRNTRRYAKRQITWFKKYKSNSLFTKKDRKKILNFILEKMKNQF